LAADRLVAREQEVRGEHGLPAAERHDERRQPAASDEQAVDEADQHAKRQPADDGERRRQPKAKYELAHHDGAEHHDRADREIDAGRQHDERLRRTDDADDGDLL
jgi:hypothetical protein